MSVVVVVMLIARMFSTGLDWREARRSLVSKLRGPRETIDKTILTWEPRANYRKGQRLLKKVVRVCGVRPDLTTANER